MTYDSSSIIDLICPSSIIYHSSSIFRQLSQGGTPYLIKLGYHSKN